MAVGFVGDGDGFADGDTEVPFEDGIAVFGREACEEGRAVGITLEGEILAKCFDGTIVFETEGETDGVSDCEGKVVDFSNGEAEFLCWDGFDDGIVVVYLVGEFDFIELTIEGTKVGVQEFGREGCNDVLEE